MNRKQLFTNLNKLCNEMDIFYNTGCGGCCFVTACLAENLERNNIPFRIIILDQPCHYFIRVSDRYINRCDFNIRGRHYRTYDFDSQTLYKIYNEKSWNCHYNRKWNLIVSTRIKSIFRKYENSRT